jgi:hypothetical protein
VAEATACYTSAIKSLSDREDVQKTATRGPRTGLSHQALDELKCSIALAVTRQFTPNEIRARILANLRRWREQGA